jgi:hypothetical protein
MVSSPGRWAAMIMTLGGGSECGPPEEEDKIDNAVCKPVIPAPRIATVFWVVEFAGGEAIDD